MKPDEPVRVEEFTKISPLIRAYELRPDRAYLIVCSAKDFREGLAYSLFKDIREMHPDLNVAVVATMNPQSVEVREGIISPDETDAPHSK